MVVYWKCSASDSEPVRLIVFVMHALLEMMALRRHAADSGVGVGDRKRGFCIHHHWVMEHDSGKGMIDLNILSVMLCCTSP